MLSQDLQQLHSHSQTQGPGGGDQTEEGSGEHLGHFLETSHLQGYRAAHCPVYFTSGFLLSALYQAGQPNPQGTGRLPQAEALTSGQ